MRSFRNTHGIAVYADGEWAERGEVTLTEAARILNLNPLTVLRQIHAGIIPAEQYCKGAPWVIKRRSIEDPGLVGARQHVPPQRSVIIKSRSEDPCLPICSEMGIMMCDRGQLQL